MRHAIKGARPGQSYWTEHGYVHTHPVDGGARLSEDQRAALAACGYELIVVAEETPAEGAPTLDSTAQAEIEANRAAAARAAAEATIPSKADLANAGRRGKAKQ